MTAAEAKLRTDNAKRSSEANQEIRIRTTMNRLFEAIKEKASQRNTWIYFNDLSTFKIDQEDYAEVLKRLKDLGYTHTTNSWGNEMICW
jgi:hypothetical protein